MGAIPTIIVIMVERGFKVPAHGKSECWSLETGKSGSTKFKQLHFHMALACSNKFDSMT